MDKNGFRLIGRDGAPAEIGQLVHTDSGEAGTLCWAFAPEPTNADERRNDQYRQFFGDAVLINVGDFAVMFPPATWGMRWVKTNV